MSSKYITIHKALGDLLIDIYVLASPLSSILSIHVSTTLQFWGFVYTHLYLCTCDRQMQSSPNLQTYRVLSLIQ